MFDRAQDISHVQLGTGIHLWPNAMKALAQIELAEPMSDVGSEVEHARFLDSKGNFLTQFHPGEAGRRVGAVTVGILRGAAHKVLTNALDHPSALRLGAECTGFDQDQHGVTLKLAGGREERGDFLVGADGLRSVVRAKLIGDEPRYASSSWVGLVEFEREDAPSDALNVVWGPGKGFIFFHAGGRTLSWIGNIVADAQANGGAPPLGTRKPALRAEFEGWTEPVTSIIEATEEDQIALTHIFDRPPTKEWGTGRVTLLGDAAHPMIPTVTQGACQAIEDGVVLAKCVTSGDDVEATLRSYEKLRIPRTARLQQTSRRLAKVGEWHSPLACGLRNQLFKRFGKLAEKQEEKEVFAHDV